MAPDSRPAPEYGLISVAAPFLEMVASFGFLLLTVGFRALNQWPDLAVRANRLGMLAMVILVGSCLAGLASAIAAFLRSEVVGPRGHRPDPQCPAARTAHPGRPGATRGLVAIWLTARRPGPRHRDAQPPG